MSKDNSITTRGSRVNKVTSVIMAFVLAFGLCPTPGKAYAADPAPSEESANLTAATADLQAADDGEVGTSDADMSAQDGGVLSTSVLTYYPYAESAYYDEDAGDAVVVVNYQPGNASNGQFGTLATSGTSRFDVTYTDQPITTNVYYKMEQNGDKENYYVYLGNPDWLSHGTLTYTKATDSIQWDTSNANNDSNLNGTGFFMIGRYFTEWRDENYEEDVQGYYPVGNGDKAIEDIEGLWPVYAAWEDAVYTLEYHAIGTAQIVATDSGHVWASAATSAGTNGHNANVTDPRLASTTASSQISDGLAKYQNDGFIWYAEKAGTYWDPTAKSTVEFWEIANPTGLTSADIDPRQSATNMIDGTTGTLDVYPGYKITYVYNDGTSDQDTTSYHTKWTTGGNLQYPEVGAPSSTTKKSSDFVGWYTAPTGGTEVNGGDSFVLENNGTLGTTAVTTLYAHWKDSATTYTVTADGDSNGSLAASNTSGLSGGESITLTATANSGYELDTLTVDGSAVTATDNGDGTYTYTFTMPDHNVTANATFKAKSYTITNSTPSTGASTNNGYLTTSVTTATEGTTVTVTPTGSPSAGYELDTLTITNDTTSAAITPTAQANGTYTFTMPGSDVTVSATFKAKKMTITYAVAGDVPSGVTACGSTTVDYGSSYTILGDLDASSYPGYYHTGWKYGTFGQSDTISSVTRNITIADTWSKMKYNLVFELGSDKDTKGTFVTDASKQSRTIANCEFGTSVSTTDLTTTANVKTENGWTFNGWQYTDANGDTATMSMDSLSAFVLDPTSGGIGGTGFQLSSSSGGTGTITFTPYFTQSFSVVYLPNPNGAFKKVAGKTEFQGLSSGDSFPAYAGEMGTETSPIDKTSAPLGRPGYTFKGWTWSDQSTPTTTLPTTVDKSYTLYANWEADKYYVNLNMAGGSFNGTAWGTVDATTGFYQREFDVDASVTLPTNVQRAGYTFAGWQVTVNTATDTTTEPLAGTTPTSFTMPAGNVTLAAQWTPNTNTAWKVTHYLQDADGTGYTKQGVSDNMTGTTGDTIAYATAAAKVRSFSNYTLDQATTESTNGTVTIGGDGQTEYGLYYSRDTFTITYQHGTTDTAITSAVTLPDNETGILWGSDQTKPNDLTAPAGWTFTGWTASPSVGTGTSYTMPAADLEWTANWSQDSYTVKFETSTTGTTDGATAGGTVSAKSGGSLQVSATYGQKVDPAANVTHNPTMQNYYFTGWTIDGDSTNTLYSDSDVAAREVTGNVTYKAQWDKKYVVKYKMGSNASSTATDESKYVEPNGARPAYTGMGGDTAPAAATGYAFEKWTWEKADGTAQETLPSTITSADVKLNSTSDYYEVEFTANFQPKTYTVTFDVNGGTLESGFDVTQVTKNGQAYDAAEMFSEMNKISGWEDSIKRTGARTGYTFKGWNTKADGTGKTVTNATVFKDAFSGNNNTETIYAAWEPNELTISYDRNASAATGTDPSSISMETGSNVPVAANPYTYTGHRFTGWNTAADGSGTSVAGGGQLTITDALGAGDITLYAQWAESGYTVKYQSGGGTLKSGATAPSDVNLTFTQSFDVAANVWEKSGSVFTGWAVTGDTAAGAPSTLAENATGISGLSSKDGGVIYLTATWSQQVTIDYNTNGGTWGTDPGSTTQASGGSYTVTSETVTKDGYTFDGWYTNASLTGTKYSAGDTLSNVTSNTTFYASWTANTNTQYTVNYWVEKVEETHTAGSEYEAYSTTPTATKTGTTGSTIALATAALASAPAGYTLNSAKWTSATIAGDGSTTVNVYYDLTPVTITFSTGLADSGETKPVPFTPGTITLANQRPGAKVSIPANNIPDMASYPGWTHTEYVETAASAGTDTAVTITNESGTYTFTAPMRNVALQDLWTRANLEVTFQAVNNGTVTANTSQLTQTIAYGDYADAAGITKTPTGAYVFAGWTYETYDGTNWNPVYVSGSTTTQKVVQDSDIAVLSITSNTRFTALFSPTHTIEWSVGAHADAAAVNVTHPNLTEYPMNTSTIKDNYEYKNGTGITTDTPAAETGYTFASWQWDDNGTTKNSVDNKSDFDALMAGGVTQSITFTALWTASAQTVTLLLDGGSFAADYQGNGSPTAGSWNTSTTTGATVTLPTPAQVLKNGATLSGWKVTANSATDPGEATLNKAFGTNGVSFKMPAGDVTLEAQWSYDNVTYDYTAETGGTVTAALPDGTAVSTPQTIASNEEAANVAIATAVPDTGYEFVGWYDSAGNEISSSSAAATASGTVITPRQTQHATNGTTNYAYAGGTFTAKFKKQKIETEFAADMGVEVKDARGSAKSIDYGTKIGSDDFDKVTVDNAPNGYERKQTANGLDAWEVFEAGVSKGEIDTPTDYVVTVSKTRFVAKWSPKTATVKFDANEGAGTMNDMTSSTDATETLTANAFSRTGYKFAGWNTKADGTGTSYADSASVTLSYATLTGDEDSNDAQLTLYAQWTEDDYSIVYHSNDKGFDGAMTSVTGNDQADETDLAQYNSEYTIAANSFGTPTVSGQTFVFAGWSTMSDGAASGAVSYAPGDKITVPAATTDLYAQWKEDSVTVKFMPGEHGQGTMADQTFLSSTSATSPQSLTANAFTPENDNWRFGGWATSEDNAKNGQIAYSDTAAYWYAKGDATLYAVWVTTSEYKVEYYDPEGNYLGSTATFADQMVKYDKLDSGQTLNIKATDANKADFYTSDYPEDYYNFLGWSVSSGNTGTVIADTDTYKNVLAAQFGTGYTESSQNRTVRLYQVFTVKAYDVKFDPNTTALAALGITSPDWGSVTSMADLHVTKGATTQANPLTVSEPATTYQIKGLKFLGWSETDGATTADLEPDASNADKVTVEGDDDFTSLTDDDTEVTLYAVWEVETYDVEFYNFDTSDDSTSLYDSATGLSWYDTVPTPKAGYKDALNQNVNNLLELYGGWYSQTKGAGVQFDIDAPPTYGQLATAIEADGNATSQNLAEKVQLFVNWVSNGGKITYNANYGSLTPESGSATPTDTIFAEGATSVTLSSGASLKVAGYKLTGWNTAADGTGTDYALSGTISNPPSGTTEVFAQWELRQDYALNFDANGGAYADASTVDTQSVQWAQTNLAPAAAPTRAGYTLEGWYFVANPTGTDVAMASTDAYSDVVAKGNDKFNEDEQTVYAKWAKRSDYKVNYLNQDDSVAATQATDLAWDTPVAEATAPAKTGYTFQGWFTEKDGNGSQVDNTLTYGDLAVTDKDELNVYAYYTADEVDITYTLLAADVTAGTVTTGGDTIPADMTEKTYTTGAVTGSSVSATVATNDGYTFEGWFEVELVTSYNSTDGTYSSDYQFKGSAITTDDTLTWTPSAATPLTGGTYAPKFSANTNTAYTVEYYQENLDTSVSKYARVDADTVNGTGTTGDVVTAPSKVYMGFTENPSASGTLTSSAIAGDGSTVLKVYFDRNSYDVSYVYTNAPVGVQAAPATASYKYGATVTVATTPYTQGSTYNGYAFGDWTTLDAAITSGSFTMPAKNVKLTGDWTKESYTVKFTSGSNGTVTGDDQTVEYGDKPSKYDTDGTTELVTATPDSGYYLSGWTYTIEGDATTYSTGDPFSVAITGNTTFTAQFNKSFVVSYQPGDETKGAFAGNVANKTLWEDIPATGAYVSTRAPYAGDTDTVGQNKDNPKAKPGWKFAGWTWTVGSTTYTTAGSYGPASATAQTESQRMALAVTQDITFVAEWAPTTQLIRYHQKSQDDITGSWSGVTGYSLDTSAAGDIVYYAQHQTTDTKAARNDTTNPQVTINLGASNLTKTGMTLVQWVDKNGNYYNENDKIDMPGTDLDLYPVWQTQTYTIKYAAETGGTVTNTEDTNVPAVEPDASNPTAKGSTAEPGLGYTFSQWMFEGTTPYGSNATFTPVGTDANPLVPTSGNTITFKALFTPAKFSITVSSDAGGTLTQNLPIPATDYNAAIGNKWNTRIRTAADAGYVAGKTNKAWRYQMDEVIGRNADGTWQTQTVVGYTDTPESVVIKGNTRFFAQWEEQSAYNVDYYVDGVIPTSIPPRTGLKWTDTVGDQTASKKGYTFVGWSKSVDLSTPAIADDAAVSDVASSPNPATANNIKLYAMFDENSFYEVNYEPNGGTAVDAKTGQKWTSAGYNETTTFEGKKFEGWYLDQALTDNKALASVKTGTAANDVTFGDMVDALDGTNATTNRTKVTLYGKWSDKLYTVNYVTTLPDSTPNGTVASRTDVKWNDEDLVRTDAASTSNYRFEGWYTLQNGNGEKVEDATRYSALAADDTETAITLYAHYVAVVPYSVYYEIPDEDDVIHEVDSQIGDPAYGLSPNSLTAEEGETVVATPPEIAGYEVDSDAANVTVSATTTSTASGTLDKLTIFYKQKSNYKVTFNPDPNDEYAAGTEDYAKNYVPGADAYKADYDALNKDGVKWLDGNIVFDDQGEQVAPPERKGYEFLGWVVGEDGDTPVTPQTDQFKQLAGGEEPENGTVALYASWKELPETVTYKTANPDAGTVKFADAADADADEELSEIIGTATGKPMDDNGDYVAGADGPHGATIVMTDEQKELYVFIGWTVDRTVVGSDNGAFSDDEEIAPARLLDNDAPGLYKETTYTANFAERAVLLYDKNAPAGASIAGEDPEGPADGYVGLSVKVAASPYTSSAYEFTGWNTKPDGSGVSYDANSDITLTKEPITLYAQWQEVAVPTTVTVLQSQGGIAEVDDGINPIIVNVGDRVPAAKISNTPNQGYTFVGYDVADENGKVTRVAASALGTIVVTGPTTVTPIFELEKHDDSNWTRLGGKDAYGTMQQIADTAFPNGSDYAIVARDDGYWDALTASGLAGFLNCPILLTTTAELKAETRQELEKLGVKHVIIAGMQNAVSWETQDQIAALSQVQDVTRVGGANASGTALEIYKYAKRQGFQWSDEVLIATAGGFWDALAGSPYSFSTHTPILLAQQFPNPVNDSMPDAMALDADVITLIAQEGFGQITILGGPAAVSDQAEIQLAGRNVQRWWGANAVETSQEIADHSVQNGMSPDNVGVATTEGYWDALTGAPLAGSLNAPIILCDPNSGSSASKGFVEKYADYIGSGFVFGGEAALSKEIFDSYSSATE